MRLIYIHGIGQEGKDPAALAASWTTSLRKAGVNDAALIDAKPTMAYYGDILAEGSGAISANEGALANLRRKEFAVQIAADMLGAAKSLVASAQDATVLAVERQKLLKVVNGLLDPASPPEIANPFDLADEIFDYLTKESLREEIDNAVAAYLVDQPMTIVVHSLGTLVAYRLLRDRKLPCRRLVTLGSPLSFGIVRSQIGTPYNYPAKLTDWRNCFDPADLVCLGRAFPPQTKWSPRLLHEQVDNRHEFGHDANGYLETPAVARAVAEAIGG